MISWTIEIYNDIKDPYVQLELKSFVIYHKCDLKGDWKLVKNYRGSKLAMVKGESYILLDKVSIK